MVTWKELEDWQQMMGELAPVQSVLDPAREATEAWLEGKRVSLES